MIADRDDCAGAVRGGSPSCACIYTHGANMKNGFLFSRQRDAQYPRGIKFARVRGKYVEGVAESMV